MKTILTVFILSGIATAQIRPDAILRSKVISDSTIVQGGIENHNWEYPVLERIDNSKYLCGNYRGIRHCTICGRTETFHDTLWVEKLRKKK